MSGLPDILTNVLTYIVAISILVAIHEFGHFWVARRLGIKVLRFSIGFGRVMWRRMGADGTEYALSAIPLGGYVRMLDEREAGVAPADLPHAFNRQPVWKRIAVLLAGPGFNFIFAIAAYWILLQVGVPGLTPVVGDVTPHSLAAEAGMRKDDLIQRVGSHAVETREAAVVNILREIINDGVVDLRVVGKDRSEREIRIVATGRSRELTQPDALLSGLGFDFWYPSIPAVVGKLVADGAAANAGVHEGDEFMRFDGEPVADFLQLRKMIESHANRTVAIELRRQNEYRTLDVAVGQATTEDGRIIGRIGIQPAPVVVPAGMQTVQRYSGLSAVTGAIAKTYETGALTIDIVWKIVTGHVSLKSISGPIGIATVTGLAAKQGIMSFLTLLALISISIGVLNLLPIPILDGGQIVYQLAELLKGGPVSERAQALGQQLGFVLLILLMLLATYNDVMPHLG